MADRNELVCSFCGKTNSQVRKMIAGPNVYICNECIDLCKSMIDESKSYRNSAKKAGCRSLLRSRLNWTTMSSNRILPRRALLSRFIIIIRESDISKPMN